MYFVDSFLKSHGILPMFDEAQWNSEICMSYFFSALHSCMHMLKGHPLVVTPNSSDGLDEDLETPTEKANKGYWLSGYF